jgi:hypothetical protein
MKVRHREKGIEDITFEAELLVNQLNNAIDELVVRYQESSPNGKRSPSSPAGL